MLGQRGFCELFFKAKLRSLTDLCASQDRQKGGFKKEVEEEFEDSQGNVYNRKTYEDLKRQGLI